MRSPRQESIPFAQPADAVFAAALGLAQNAKNITILAVHNEGRKLVLRERSKMSNPKFQQLWVEDAGGSAVLHLLVGTDPRSPKALMDGRANDKSLKKYVEEIQAVVAGKASAAVAPVANHYLAKKTEIAWLDPDQAPEIELDGAFLANFGL